MPSCYSATSQVRWLMRRLALLWLVALGMMMWPLRLNAQQSAVPAIGFLTTASLTSQGGEQLIAFHSGLREGGYAEGQNVRIEYRWANDNYARLHEMAAELA